MPSQVRDTTPQSSSRPRFYNDPVCTTVDAMPDGGNKQIDNLILTIHSAEKVAWVG